MNDLYINQEVQVDGSWYAPLEHLKEQEGVTEAHHWDTTSSAGDWDGYFIQKQGNKYYLITFYQENNGFGNVGFTLHTDGVRFEFETKPKEEEIPELMNAIWSAYTL